MQKHSTLITLCENNSSLLRKDYWFISKLIKQAGAREENHSTALNILFSQKNLIEEDYKSIAFR